MHSSVVNELEVSELMQWQQTGKLFELLDVRESHERDAFHIGGLFIPMAECLSRAGEIPVDQPVVVYCRKGVRSAIIIQRLTDKYAMHNLYNLKGGLVAWQAYAANRAR